MKQAYYTSSVLDFLSTSPHNIIGQLAEQHPFDLDPLQRNAWLAEIDLLQTGLSNDTEGWLALEFSIPRVGRRVDAIIAYDGIILVVEFKVGGREFTAAAIDQATDYALDLKNFHAGSHERHIVPIVVATNAKAPDFSLHWGPDGVSAPILSGAHDLENIITHVRAATPKQLPLDFAAWMTSGYKPTPSIIEAAQALYRGHKVEDITRSDAGAKNLSETTARLEQIIEDAKASGEKTICFVTGVPGAGKTLAGLNLVTHRTKAHEEEHAVFLSGNGPLVDVLREALARDEQAQAHDLGQPIRKSDAERKVKSFIQNIHHFRDANLVASGPPIERVVVFDEAQRAWNLDQAAKFMSQKKGISDFGMSEPEFLISVMDRHTDWCTVVCLVGGGQEINSGEAGLLEWLAALKKRFPRWRVYTSPQLTHRDYHWGDDLPAMIASHAHESLGELHLAVSVRSFRAEALSAFVGALIAGEPAEARDLYASIRKQYPIAITRDLSEARAWLRKQARGTERFGLVASSGASRLKAEGVNVHEKIGATYWFLNDKTDVRSSYYLEDPATEFDVQGLELDWVAVCWDADLRRADSEWSYHKFRGTVWQRVNNPSHRTYLANAYRVLLTRARQGMIIYVPRGDAEDATRPPNFYNGIYAYLQECGLAPVS